MQELQKSFSAKHYEAFVNLKNDDVKDPRLLPWIQAKKQVATAKINESEQSIAQAKKALSTKNFQQARASIDAARAI